MIQFTASEDRIVHTSFERATEEEEELLLLLLEDPAFTYTVLAEKPGVSCKTISARIQSLKQKGILQRVGSDTKGYWKINASSGQSDS